MNRAINYGVWAGAVILLLIGIIFPPFPNSVQENAGSSGWLSAGLFSSGVFSAGLFSVGIYSAGVFSVGVFSAGIFSLGIFSFGTFALGVWAAGQFVSGWKKNKLRESTQGEKQ
ncbi:MAG: hypothetical protein ACYC5N_04530 [Endomicrobiales bacterium]